MKQRRKPNPNFSGISFFLFFSALLWTVNSDLAADTAALLALRAAVHGDPLQWNASISPCAGWRGVTCFGGRVTNLRLPGSGLAGQLPLGIGNLTQLQTLSLRFNALSGTIPADFANLTELRNLYLHQNKLSGEIPAFLFTLPNLVRLNLAQNNFTGPIPATINNSKRLATLLLEDNHLSGSIEEINVPTLQLVNVSNNNLDGSIPASFSGMPESSFEGNSLCGAPLVSCKGSKISSGAIAGIVIGSVILVILVVLVCFCARKHHGKKSETKDIVPTQKSAGVEIHREVKAMSESTDNSVGFSPGVVSRNKNLVFFGNTTRVFDLEDLLRASAEVLGKGTYGTAYKATLDMGVLVAVKRLRDVMVPEKEFREKMEVIGSMNHENLVPLKAYYYSRDEKLMVYDYMPMGSLSALLHGNRGDGRTPLNWDTRLLVALGAAKGIAYLHSNGSTVSHGNIKSSNILLTKSFEGRVSDFGLAQLAGSTVSPIRVDGYRAPEVTDTHRESQKADVYSFGVFLLELLTGKAPTHALEEGVDLPRWVQSTVQEEWSTEVFDMELLRYQSVEEDMVELLQLAVHCTAQQPDKRPSMAEVTSQIERLSRTSSQQDDDVFDDTSFQQTSIDSGGPPASSVNE